MKNLKASVLIANYNNQKYIQECLNSLQNQTYKNFEIIFHDDNSNDTSVIEAKKFKRVKIIKNLKRGKFGSHNQLAAYERAFKKSKGEIIFFLDSDDLFVKNKIEKILRLFNTNETIKVIYDLPIFLKNKDKEFIKNKKKLINNMWPYIPPQSCISIRRKDFKKIINKIKLKKFNNIWMDFRMAIFLKYIEKNFFILEKNLTIYRQNTNSVSSNFKFLSKKWWKRRLEAHEYIKVFFKKNKINYKNNIDYFLTRLIVFILN